MSLSEFMVRGIRASNGYTDNWLDDERPIWEDDPERRKRQLHYRYSTNYKRTFWECIRLDLKVLLRVLKRRIRNGRRRTQ